MHEFQIPRQASVWVVLVCVVVLGHGLAGRADAQSQPLAAMQTQLNALQAQVSALTATVNALRTQVAALPTSSRKSYYLTRAGVPGNHAVTACDAGFHMASLWELF